MDKVDKSDVKKNWQPMNEEKKKKKIIKKIDKNQNRCIESKNLKFNLKLDQQPQSHQQQQQQNIQKSKIHPQNQPQLQLESQLSEQTIAKSLTVRKPKTDNFPHIPKKEPNVENLTKDLALPSSSIHPSVIKVGLRMNRSLISGSTQRCVAMLISFQELISSYSTPCDKDFSRGLESAIDESVKFLHRCRPLAVSMRNAITYVNLHLSKIPSGEEESTARKNLIKLIDKFINVEIEFAIKAIQKDGASKIDNNNEVILTYGNSLLVKHIIHKACLDGKKFRVIVVDSRPRLAGKKLIKFLINHNIRVTYTHINAIAYVMKEVTKVLIGAHALLGNGYVMACLGTSQIALVAKAYNVPVLVCCETYKFSERVHTDSFVLNESGPVEDFFQSESDESCKLKTFLTNEQEKYRHRLNILNLFYDITPSNLISLVITEKGFLPCSSVPAVIRKNIDKFQLNL